MGNIQTALNQFNLTISASTAAKTLIAAIVGRYVDITSLFLANSSATATLVTLSDGTNSYEYEVPANGSVVLDTTDLQATSQNTAWTLTCATSVTSLYASGTHSYRN